MFVDEHSQAMEAGRELTDSNKRNIDANVLRKLLVDEHLDLGAAAVKMNVSERDLRNFWANQKDKIVSSGWPPAGIGESSYRRQVAVDVGTVNPAQVEGSAAEWTPSTQQGTPVDGDQHSMLDLLTSSPPLSSRSPPPSARARAGDYGAMPPPSRGSAGTGASLSPLQRATAAAAEVNGSADAAAVTAGSPAPAAASAASIFGVMGSGANAGVAPPAAQQQQQQQQPSSASSPIATASVVRSPMLIRPFDGGVGAGWPMGMYSMVPTTSPTPMVMATDGSGAAATPGGMVVVKVEMSGDVGAGGSGGAQTTAGQADGKPAGAADAAAPGGGGGAGGATSPGPGAAGAAGAGAADSAGAAQVAVPAGLTATQMLGGAGMAQQYAFARPVFFTTAGALPGGPAPAATGAASGGLAMQIAPGFAPAPTIVGLPGQAMPVTWPVAAIPMGFAGGGGQATAAYGGLANSMQRRPMQTTLPGIVAFTANGHSPTHLFFPATGRIALMSPDKPNIDIAALQAASVPATPDVIEALTRAAVTAQLTMNQQRQFALNRDFQHRLAAQQSMASPYGKALGSTPVAMLPQVPLVPPGFIPPMPAHYNQHQMMMHAQHHTPVSVSLATDNTPPAEAKPAPRPPPPPTIIIPKLRVLNRSSAANAIAHFFTNMNKLLREENQQRVQWLVANPNARPMLGGPLNAAVSATAAVSAYAVAYANVSAATRMQQMPRRGSGASRQQRQSMMSAPPPPMSVLQGMSQEDAAARGWMTLQSTSQTEEGEAAYNDMVIDMGYERQYKPRRRRSPSPMPEMPAKVPRLGRRQQTEDPEPFETTVVAVAETSELPGTHIGDYGESSPSDANSDIEGEEDEGNDSDPCLNESYAAADKSFGEEQETLKRGRRTGRPSRRATSPDGASSSSSHVATRRSRRQNAGRRMMREGKTGRFVAGRGRGRAKAQAAEVPAQNEGDGVRHDEEMADAAAALFSLGDRKSVDAATVAAAAAAAGTPLPSGFDFSKLVAGPPMRLPLLPPHGSQESQESAQEGAGSTNADAVATEAAQQQANGLEGSSGVPGETAGPQQSTLPQSLLPSGAVRDALIAAGMPKEQVSKLMATMSVAAR